MCFNFDIPNDYSADKPRQHKQVLIALQIKFPAPPLTDDGLQPLTGPITGQLETT